ncbi:MAG: PilN domain-containing protein [Thermoleophilia bacterium]|nr:PilN domain-containing protein [Thermoleophilia bacterium]
MRPVNLIPEEERLGSRRPMRSGPTAYILVGALVAALLGVTSLVVTSNQVDDLQREVVQIEGEVSAAEAKAHELDAYTQFHYVREQRVATITSLADSRFDWERVMRELALVLPDDVSLTSLTASANPAVAPAGGASVSLRSSIPGPALSLTGCARGQDGVAGFVQALKDIDGVTRVGVQASSLTGGETVEADSAGSSAGCETRNFLAQFEMAVAFDAAPIAGMATEAAPEVAPSSPESEAVAEE